MDKDITLEQEFDLVFKAHYSLVKNFALMLLKSGQDADDIAQDVFTRLWAKPQIWQDNPGIDKYIYAMTKHAIFDFLKNGLTNRHRWKKVFSRICLRRVIHWTLSIIKKYN